MEKKNLKVGQTVLVKDVDGKDAYGVIREMKDNTELVTIEFGFGKVYGIMPSRIETDFDLRTFVVGQRVVKTNSGKHGVVERIHAARIYLVRLDGADRKLFMVTDHHLAPEMTGAINEKH